MFFFFFVVVVRFVATGLSEWQRFNAKHTELDVGKKTSKNV